MFERTEILKEISKKLMYYKPEVGQIKKLFCINFTCSVCSFPLKKMSFIKARSL